MLKLTDITWLYHHLPMRFSLTVERGEQLAILGPSGAGKSTLLNLIAGFLTPASGLLTIDGVDHTTTPPSRRPVSMLFQENNLFSHLTVAQNIGLGLNPGLKLNAAQQKKMHAIAHQMGIDNLMARLPGELSGGQRQRVALARCLVREQPILLLDEPTNHLDMNSISWLETYLLNYDGAVLIVSHDRYFLNRVVTKVVEIEYGSIMTYMGNYSDYAQKKKMIREAKLKEYLNQQQEIKHQEAVIEKLRSFNREKSIRRAESREKMLEKMDVIEKPMGDPQELHFSLEPSCISGNDVLEVEHLSKAFGNHKLFQDISFEIKRGEHVAIIGDNGTGKTTLLKILNQVVAADSGSFKLGSKVQIGYYDQEHHVLHMEKNIFDEISDDYPSLNNTQIRNTLAAFLFTGDDVYKLISDLSGGERGRVSLAKLMLSEANFLILDEPTNHLDIASKEILEKALNDYIGTVLYVSHDRYFINQTATRILDLVNGTFVNYIGNYDYYLEKKEELTAAYAGISEISTPSVSSTSVESDTKLDWKAQKEAQAKERKRQNDLKKTEDAIAKLEERDSEIDELMTQEEVFTNSVRCRELSEEKAKIAEELETLYMRWEELAE